MYTIGQFSKIGRVSPKTLRYYDEIDLLKPNRVDQENQYRYYSQEQVLQVLLISELKEYGLRLEEIKAIMDKRDVSILKTFLENKLAEIDIEVHRNLELKKVIHQKISKIESGGSLMEKNRDLAVELKEKEILTVISKRATINMDSIGNIIGKVYEEINKMKLQQAGPLMTVYHDKEFDVDSTDLEVCVPINKKFTAEKNENIKDFGGGLHACTTFVGPYSRLGEAYAKIMSWINENGYKSVGAPYDIYITSPESAKSPEHIVTEVCFPVSK